MTCGLTIACVGACGGDDPAATTDPGKAEVDIQPTPDDMGGQVDSKIVPDVPDDPGPTPDVGQDDGPVTPDTSPPPCVCEDENPCTEDKCNKEGVCIHPPLKTPECKPTVAITYPAQAATLAPTESFDPMLVEGTWTAPLGLDSLTLNDEAITGADGAFSDGMPIHHGINTAKVIVEDSIDGSAKALHSVIIGEGFYGTTNGLGPDAVVTNGLVAFLGQEVFDDDNDDMDDLATVTTLLLEGLDIKSLLPNPLEVEIATCDFTITFDKVAFEISNVDLAPVDGGLTLDATLDNVVVKLDAVAPWCPDATETTVTIDSITVDTVVWISLLESNNVDVQLGYVDVTIAGVDVDIEGGTLSLVDWLVTWFTDTFTDYVEDAIEDAVGDNFAPLISSALEGFTSYETKYTLPELPGGLNSVELSIAVQPTYISFLPDGAVIGLGMAVTAPKAAEWIDSPGSIARNGCFGGEGGALEIPKTSPI